MKVKENKTKLLKVSDLKIIPFNRSIIMSIVAKLLNSVKQNGVLRKPVIVKTVLFGNKISYYIIDGQHLIAALIRADIKDVDCIIVESENTAEIVDMMATLNNVGTPWKLGDYVNAYCSLNNDSYSILRSHKLSTGFNYSVSAKILGNSSSSEIKNGGFKSICQDTDKLTEHLIDICAFLKTDNAKFMKAFINFFRTTKDYNHKKLMRAVAQNKKNLVIVHDEGAMKNLLHKIYSVK